MKRLLPLLLLLPLAGCAKHEDVAVDYAPPPTSNVVINNVPVAPAPPAVVINAAPALPAPPARGRAQVPAKAPKAPADPTARIQPTYPTPVPTNDMYVPPGVKGGDKFIHKTQ